MRRASSGAAASRSRPVAVDRRGRDRPALPGRDAPVHAAAHPAAARGRAAAGHDQRQPRRGADRQGLGGDRPPGARSPTRTWSTTARSPCATTTPSRSCSGGRPRLIRRSRGYAPFPVALPRPLPQTLACGAELKNTFCLTRDANAFLSQHIGDLENLETLEHYETSIERLRAALPPRARGRRLRPAPRVPGDQVRASACRRSEKVAVQHHHAHVAALLVEHGREDAGDRRQHGRARLR